MVMMMVLIRMMVTTLVKNRRSKGLAAGSEIWETLLLHLKCYPPLSLSVIVLINHCILSVTSVVIFSSIYPSSLSVVKRPIIIVFLCFCHYFFIRISEVNHKSLSSMSVIVAINICHQYFICHQRCYHWCFLVSFYYSGNAFEGTQHIYRAGGWWCDRHLSKEAGDPLEEAAAAP